MYYDQEAKAALCKFNGVGPKTAACVLMFALQRPVIPL
jgi:3-methyladenine DNA glycosylase/8-oxoguanine DNA glycosylase